MPPSLSNYQRTLTRNKTLIILGENAIIPKGTKWYTKKGISVILLKGNKFDCIKMDQLLSYWKGPNAIILGTKCYHTRDQMLSY